MKPSEAIESFRRRCNQSRLYHNTAVAGWNKVCDAIQADALAKRPKPKVLRSAPHTTEVARFAFIESMLAGRETDIAIAEALNSVGITLS